MAMVDKLPQQSFFGRAYRFLTKRKKIIALVFSVIALATSAVNYCLTTWWNLHEVTVIVLEHTTEDEGAKLWLLFANSGKRAEIVTNVDIALQRELSPNEFELLAAVTDPDPLILEPSSVARIHVSQNTMGRLLRKVPARI